MANCNFTRRVHVRQSKICNVMFNFEHSCTDCVSSIKFCKQFLNNMNELANGTSSVDQEISSLELLPQVHEIVFRRQLWHSLYNLLLTYCDKILAIIIKNKPNNPYYENFHQIQKSSTCVFHAGINVANVC